MSTASTDERLSAYLDGELTDTEAAALEQELDRSASLRAQLDALTMVVRTLGDDGPVRAPLSFHAAVMDRIEQEHPQASWWQGFVRRPFGIPHQGWGVMLAAAAVLLVVQLGRSDSAEPVLPEGDPVWRDVEAPAAAKLKALPEEPAVAPAVDKEAAPPKQAPEKSQERGAKPEMELPPELGEPDSEGIADDPEEGVLRAPPSGFTLLTADPSALRDVLALVGKHGGSVTAADGSPITKAVLEQGQQTVLLRIPSNRLAAFQKELSLLGNMKAAFEADKLYSGSDVSVPLTLVLSGEGSAEPYREQQKSASPTANQPK